MTKLKEDLADVLTRIEALEKERADKIYQHLSELSGFISENYWDVIHPDFYGKAQNLARLIGSIYQDYDEAKTWYHDNKYKVDWFWSNTFGALFIGVFVGALIMYLLG